MNNICIQFLIEETNITREYSLGGELIHETENRNNDFVKTKADRLEIQDFIVKDRVYFDYNGMTNYQVCHNIKFSNKIESISNIVVDSVKQDLYIERPVFPQSGKYYLPIEKWLKNKRKEHLKLILPDNLNTGEDALKRQEYIAYFSEINLISYDELSTYKWRLVHVDENGYLYVFGYDSSGIIMLRVLYNVQGDIVNIYKGEKCVSTELGYTNKNYELNRKLSCIEKSPHFTIFPDQNICLVNELQSSNTWGGNTEEGLLMPVMGDDFFYIIKCSPPQI
ncbi:hypothetical protein [uncultured Microscilla sp.]|uniref:hypothetical protein n=1 Tax=uncultured Microscilla sp. TaxID=432653 RepID=UPI00262BA766|nr:hypothetical protein [uncultured Microscilla sp.]